MGYNLQWRIWEKALGRILELMTGMKFNTVGHVTSLIEMRVLWAIRFVNIGDIGPVANFIQSTRMINESGVDDIFINRRVKENLLNVNVESVLRSLG